MIKRFSFLFLIFCFALTAHAQDVDGDDKKGKKVASVVKTFDAKVKVIGVLQGTKDLAVIQVVEVDDNKWNLKVGDEVLCKFYFTTGPFKGETYYPGVKGGEILKAEIHATPNANNVQTNYKILRYEVIGQFEKKTAKKENN